MAQEQAEQVSGTQRATAFPEAIGGGHGTLPEFRLTTLQVGPDLDCWLSARSH